MLKIPQAKIQEYVRPSAGRVPGLAHRGPVAVSSPAGVPRPSGAGVDVLRCHKFDQSKTIQYFHLFFIPSPSNPMAQAKHLGIIFNSHSYT